MNISLWFDGKEYKLSLAEKVDNFIHVTIGEKKHTVSVDFISSDEILLNIDGKVHNVVICANFSTYSVYVNGKSFRIEKKSASQILGRGLEKQQKRVIKTSMPGRIVKIILNEGDKVEEGQAVMILEAMKMQNEIKSPQSGVITKIGPEPGMSVEANALLFTVE